MPTDPVTGERLPYPGEPGGPPMGPPPGGAQMGPPPGGDMGPSPEEMEQLRAQEADMQMQELAMGAPPPDKPYKIKTIKMFSDQMDKTLDSLAGTDVEIPAWEPNPEVVEKGDRWPEPLPPEVFAPVVALIEAIRFIDPEGNYEKYMFEPDGLVGDSELKAAAGKLKMMEKDKQLAQDLQAPPGEEAMAEGEEPPPMPEGEEEPMSPDDELLSENM